MKHNWNETADFTDDMSFGQYLRKKRRLLGISQVELADYLGFQHKTICQWEKERTFPTMNIAKEIVDFLGGDIRIVNISEESEFKKRVLNCYPE